MFVVGSAGHVDHGKTSVIRVLTGQDPDRLKVEKERGITTELGFAYLTLPDGRTVSFIDAPGHERFVRHMIAGASGLDMAMLVVAADEGVMPQTREHLDILELVGVKLGFVVITKCDLVGPDDIALAREDISLALKGSFLEEAPVLEFALPRTETHEDFRRHVVSLILRHLEKATPKPLDRPLRIPIDRVFTIKGFGTVVTGTCTSGEVRVGDKVMVVPKGVEAIVRRIEHHGSPVNSARAGMRTALNLQGISVDEVERGQVVTKAKGVRSSHSLLLDLRLLKHAPKPLKRKTKLMLHTGTTQALCTLIPLDRRTIEPGERAPCLAVTEEPLATLAGDGFILRGFEPIEGYGRTLGGGTVLHPAFPATLDAAIRQKALGLLSPDPSTRLLALMGLAAPSGITESEATSLSPYGPSMARPILASLVAEGKAVLVEGDRYIARSDFDALADAVEATIRSYHTRFPDRPGATLEEVAGLMPDPPSPTLLSRVLEGLLKAHRLETLSNRYRIPGFRSRLETLPEETLSKVANLLAAAGLSPPSPSEVAKALGLDLSTVQDALRALTERGEVLRAPQGLFFHKEAIEKARKLLLFYLEAHETISTQELKALFGVSRKYAIPLAEYFDEQKVTIRIDATTRKKRPTGS